MLYKTIHSIIYDFKGIAKVYGAIFNKMTLFKGNNVIGRNTDVSNSVIGKCTYIGSNSYLPNSDIGAFCSISDNVKVIIYTHPSHTFVSTSPVFFSLRKQCGKTYVSEQLFNEEISINGKNIEIGNDVWIGTNVMIKGGIKIGNGSIIAMGSVVCNDVPPYAIVGGVPAKIIRYRFPLDVIRVLEKFQWWNMDEKWIEDNIHLFSDIKTFINKIINSH